MLLRDALVTADLDFVKGLIHQLADAGSKGHQIEDQLRTRSFVRRMGFIAWPICRVHETASPKRMAADLRPPLRIMTLVGIAGEDDLDASAGKEERAACDGHPQEAGQGPNHTRFRSRHALGLSYRTSYSKAKERYGERAWRLMDRLGAQWGEPPIRPKYMQRRTFSRLTAELGEARLRHRNALPISPSAEGTASRRINECHRGRPASHLTITPAQHARSAGCAPTRSTIIGEPEAAPNRSGAVKRMTGNHPRNIGPMPLSLRLGPNASGKPCGSPAVSGGKHRMHGGAPGSGLPAATRTR